MRVALVDSGVGLATYAVALLRRRPDLELILSLDPEHMPWGSRSARSITERVLAGARATLPWSPSAVVVACNTASVYSLGALRAELEPDIPVVGTVPAIRSAAATGKPFAVWATPRTSASQYQAELASSYANGIRVQHVVCPELAQAIEAGCSAAIDAAIARAVRILDQDIRSIVLGCTHYGLVADRIRRTLPSGIGLFDSPDAVGKQTLVRLGQLEQPSALKVPLAAVLLSGRPGRLPAVLARYAPGRDLITHESRSAVTVECAD